MFKSFLKPIFGLFSTDIALDLGTVNIRLFIGGAINMESPFRV